MSHDACINDNCSYYIEICCHFKDEFEKLYDGGMPVPQFL
jgi:hypothetical protein